MSRPLKLSRDLSKMPVERYRLPKDGRKWKRVACERMALAGWLAVHGDGDGSRIFPSVKSMIRHFGWSRRKVFYLLDDLKALSLLEPSDHYHGERGARIRCMNLPAFLEAGVQDSPGAEVQDSGAGVQDSRAEVQSNVAHIPTPNRHRSEALDFEVESWEGKRAPKSSSSYPDRSKNDDDLDRFPDTSESSSQTQSKSAAEEKSDINSAGVQSRQQNQNQAPEIDIDGRIENRKREAEDILLKRGWDGHVVSAALQIIQERSDHSGTVPASAKYYVTAFDVAMADECDKIRIAKRADRRRRAEMPSTTAELEQIASDIEHESKTSQRPVTEVLQNRAARARSA
jgi:hypothetical protein